MYISTGPWNRFLSPATNPLPQRSRSLWPRTPQCSSRKPRRDWKLPRASSPGQAMSVQVKFEAGHIVDHQCTLGERTCVKKMILPRFYQWTEFHPRLFVVKWTEVKAWLPTRFCYGLMHIDLQEWYCWKKSGMLSHVSHVYCYILSAT